MNVVCHRRRPINFKPLYGKRILNPKVFLNLKYNHQVLPLQYNPPEPVLRAYPEVEIVIKNHSNIE